MSLFKKICAVIVSELTLLSDDRLWSNPWLVVTAVMLMTCLWYIWVIWARKSIYDLFKFEILLLVQLIVQRIDIEVSLEFMDWAPGLLVEWLFNLLIYYNLYKYEIRLSRKLQTWHSAIQKFKA